MMLISMAKAKPYSSCRSNRSEKNQRPARLTATPDKPTAPNLNNRGENSVRNEANEPWLTGDTGRVNGPVENLRIPQNLMLLDPVSHHNLLRTGLTRHEWRQDYEKQQYRR